MPFGEYANRVDPSGHKTASAPLIYDMGRMAYGDKNAMNLGVIPQPYSDTGALVPRGVTQEIRRSGTNLRRRGHARLERPRLHLAAHRLLQRQRPARGGARVAVTLSTDGKGSSAI